MTVRGAIRAYQKSNVDSAAAASPYKVVQLLFEGVLDKLGQTKGFIEQNAMAKKGETLGRVMEILTVLQSSLDHDAGGEIAANLDALYNYMFRVLTEASIENDTAKIDEVIQLVAEIKAGWDAIPVDQQAA